MNATEQERADWAGQAEQSTQAMVNIYTIYILYQYICMNTNFTALSLVLLFATPTQWQISLKRGRRSCKTRIRPALSLSDTHTRTDSQTHIVVYFNGSEIADRAGGGMRGMQGAGHLGRSGSSTYRPACCLKWPKTASFQSLPAKYIRNAENLQLTREPVRLREAPKKTSKHVKKNSSFFFGNIL